MKVLIGIDDSKFSENVIQAVVNQFRPENTEVLVLHVLQPIAAMLRRKWVKATLPSWRIRKSRPVHWSNELQRSCEEWDLRRTPLSRLVTSE